MGLRLHCPKYDNLENGLQVTSRKDQAQYWSVVNTYPWKPYRYVSVKQFEQMFKGFHVGRNLAQELATSYPRERSHKAALTVHRYGVSNLELFKANFAKEYLLKKRQSFIHIFRAVLVIRIHRTNPLPNSHPGTIIQSLKQLSFVVQISIMALIAMTTFLKTTMDYKTEVGGAAYMGALFYGVIALTFSGYAEIAMTVFRLPVFFKQRDLLFYPAWTYTLPSMALSIPSSVMEAGLFSAITYYGMGFTPEASR